MLSPSAWIFDMDGVIIDSTQTHTEAWIAYLRQHGLDLPEVGSRMLGKHNDAIVRDFFCDPGMTDHDVYEHGANKESLYRELMAPLLEQKLLPGVREFLASHSSVPAAVATNAEAANVDFVLTGADLRSSFQAVVSGQDVQRPKPAPDIFLRAAAMLGAQPSSCIVFEDSITGVTAARAAGMRVVGVLSTLSELPGVDYAIRDFRDSGLDQWLLSCTIPSR
ncbi:MAG: HAD family phosphatase [Bryobacteraceae bacterium]|nr:HAD family phosphatase [Bryobacteraceae bacterium]